jgi:hypothetical protein
MIATVRAAQHGGTLVMVSRQRAFELISGSHMRLKYAFIDEEPRRRIASLVATILHEMSGFEPQGQPLGWDTYESAAVGQLAELDEALFEVAHLLADFYTCGRNRPDHGLARSSGVRCRDRGRAAGGGACGERSTSEAPSENGSGRIGWEHATAPRIACARHCVTRSLWLFRRMVLCDSSVGTWTLSRIGSSWPQDRGKSDYRSHS